MTLADPGVVPFGASTGGRPSSWPFLVGLLLVVGGLVATTASLGADFYELGFKSGAQPPGGSNPDQATITFTIDLFGITIRSPGESEDEPFSEYAAIGGHMVPLRALLIMGASLAAAGALAGLLHRFRVLRPHAVGPTFVFAGIVVLASGLTAFTVAVADAAYLELFSNGRLQPHPAFFTINADGDQVHDLHTRPLAGYWVAVSGSVSLLVGAALMFRREIGIAWHHLTGEGHDKPAAFTAPHPAPEPAPTHAHDAHDARER